jgi:hypothetical protein
MLRRILCVLTSIIVALGSLAQERPSFISQKYDLFTTDVQENIYGWTNDRLDQYSSQGEILYHYSNPSMGYISKVDASIPTKIMVYYEESNSILLLNNKLAPIGNPINLFELGILNPVMVCMFGINRLACYNETNQQLILIDLDLKQTNVINCQFDTEFHPQHIIADHNFEQLVLSDSAAGLAFYDRFGSFQKWIPVQGIHHLQLRNNILFFMKDNTIYGNDLSTLWSPNMIIGIDGMASFSKVLSNLYYIDSNGFIEKISLR